MIRSWIFPSSNRMVHGSAIELEKKHVPVPLYNQMDAEQNYDV